jgi:hypothetical protein
MFSLTICPELSQRILGHRAASLASNIYALGRSRKKLCILAALTLGRLLVMGRPNCPRAVAPRSTVWKADTHTFSPLSQKAAGSIAASAKPAAIDAPALEVTSRFLHAGLNPAGQWAPLELGTRTRHENGRCRRNADRSVF